jgi:hypothetical protein
MKTMLIPTTFAVRIILSSMSTANQKTYIPIYHVTKLDIRISEQFTYGSIDKIYIHIVVIEE